MPHPSPSPEMALLLATARVHMQGEDVDAATVALQRGVDWDLLIPLAQHHGLVPLLARHAAAGRIAPATIPTGAATTLHQWVTEGARRSLRLAGALVEILRDLAAHEIPVVPLKGPVLAHDLYGSIALRRFNDLDLLFRAPDLPRATERLRALGYRPDTSIPPAFAAVARRTLHHVSMFAATGDHRVELHYEVFPPVGRRRYPQETIAERLVPLSFHGVTVPGLPPEELLVYLSLHAAHHAWQRLEWVCGVSELLRSGRVQDWDRVAACARCFGGGRRLEAGVLIAHRLLGAPLPAPMHHPDPRARAAAQLVIDRLVSDPGRTCDAFDRLAFQLRTDTGSLARLQRCWAIVFTPYVPDVATVRLPDALRPAYHLLRPLRLMYRYRHGRHPS